MEQTRPPESTGNVNSHADCPETALLAAFLDGQEVNSHGSEIADHIARCPFCVEELSRIAEQHQCTAAAYPAEFERFVGEPKYAELKARVDALALPATQPGLQRERGVLLDRYEVWGNLGKGGVGDVYLAFDTVSGLEVAIKVCRAGWFDGEVSRQKFVDRARRGTQLEHAGLVRVRDVVTDGSETLVVMDLIRGENLSQRLLRDPPGVAAAALLMIKIARAAHAAHAAGLVHGDLKPTTILLSVTGEPMIANFGLVIQPHTTAASDTPNAWTGTPAYMSPEQISSLGAAPDCRSDVWALGVILCEMIHRQRPFPQKNRSDVRAAIQSGAVQVPALPRYPEFNVVIEKCLQLRPEDRYADASLLADDLTRALRHHFPAGIDRWRRGWWCLLLAVAICLFAIGYWLSVS